MNFLKNFDWLDAKFNNSMSKINF